MSGSTSSNAVIVSRAANCCCIIFPRASGVVDGAAKADGKYCFIWLLSSPLNHAIASSGTDSGSGAGAAAAGSGAFSTPS